MDMTQDDFKKQIEHFINRYQEKMPSASYTEQEEYRDDIRLIKATIARTLRLCLQYPELAQEYLDRLPKVTMD